ncbi:hypothetical protein DIZ27_24745 [Streptomyces sp. NWU339]|uniref:discoidin domain-containing protein n=1 Tax=Streptomyces sp. NWU339 TaxID=2185284 RepID=UPI000D67FD05|nr:discoidin domain-containing protein [Streptomyces sp. NWU339]PWI07896.1 hypothetical protein DIZ27_24745 [Streptomyces sp. NWU339]
METPQQAPRDEGTTRRLFSKRAVTAVAASAGAAVAFGAAPASAAPAAAAPHGKANYRKPVGPVCELRAETTATPALQSVQLEWDPPAGGRVIDHYLVHGSQEQGFTADAGTLLTKAPTSDFTHTGLGPQAQTWHYRVVAVDAAGNIGSIDTAPLASVTTAGAFVVAATASSQYSPAYAPHLVVDGSKNTRWAAAYTDDEWIQVELARPITSGRVELHWQGAYARDYDLLVSPDGESWTTVRSVRGKSDDSVDEFAVSGAGEFRYVRMHGVTRATKWGYSIWEFWVRPSS